MPKGNLAVLLAILCWVGHVRGARVKSHKAGEDCATECCNYDDSHNCINCGTCNHCEFVSLGEGGICMAKAVTPEAISTPVGDADCVGEWEEWSSCSAEMCTEGGGTQSRSWVVKTEKAGAGKACAVKSSNRIEVQKCNDGPCDCQGLKRSWGRCSKDCKKTSKFEVTRPAVNGGKACRGDFVTTCSKGEGDCPKCFPADALVVTPMGPKRMSELRAGDAVRSIDGSGQTFFDEVYFFGHADASASAEFVDLKLAGNVASLQLSDKHFVPKCPENRVPCDWSEHLNVYAEDVQVGDFLWAMRGEQLHLQEVIGSSVTVRDGLYNPYTLSGRVIVNGVLASAHSEWVLDTWMPESLAHYLPGVYQVVFLPGRWLYHLVGATAADALDVNNPQLAPEKNGSGPEFLVACAMLAITATLVFSFKR